ncbi:hypothetical protein JB92DRAFT_3119304 [Gautieria morchelliformis]|nr:hypothetical protein JB92DRAFT_3119304 [Gautieria morchelliformis]
MPPSDAYGAGAPSGSPIHHHEPSSDGSLSSDMSIFSQLQPIARLSMEEGIEQMRCEPHDHQQSQSKFYTPQIDPSLDSLPYTLMHATGAKLPHTNVDPKDDPSPPVAPHGNAMQLVAALKSCKNIDQTMWPCCIVGLNLSHVQYHIPKGLKAFLVPYGSFSIALTVSGDTLFSSSASICNSDFGNGSASGGASTNSICLANSTPLSDFHSWNSAGSQVTRIVGGIKGQSRVREVRGMQG